MSLLSEHMRDIAAELDVYCVRAGVAIDPRWHGLIDELYVCIKHLEESDRRLPCDCHYATRED